MRTYKDILYPELSYDIFGILFEVHNNIGRYAKEIQYSNLLEKILLTNNINCKRELTIGDSQNRIDFLIDDKIILEIKAKQSLQGKDYTQLQRYLQEGTIDLGILVNFRQRYLSPKRIIRITNWNNSNSQHSHNS